MEPLERRAAIKVRANPCVGMDYVSALSGSVGEAFEMTIRYVPDRDIVVPEDFASYLEGLTGIEWETLEACAIAVLDDFNNEVVPRWVRVEISGLGLTACLSHEVMVEDRQPRWDNPSLLTRLTR